MKLHLALLTLHFQDIWFLLLTWQLLKQSSIFLVAVPSLFFLHTLSCSYQFSLLASFFACRIFSERSVDGLCWKCTLSKTWMFMPVKFFLLCFMQVMNTVSTSCLINFTIKTKCFEKHFFQNMTCFEKQNC